MMGDPIGAGSHTLVELNNNFNYDLKSLKLMNDLPYLDLLDEISVSNDYLDETKFISSFSNSNKIIIMSCNICSIASKFIELNNLLDKLSQNNSRPDIILIEESWISDILLVTLLFLAGYLVIDIHNLTQQIAATITKYPNISDYFLTFPSTKHSGIILLILRNTQGLPLVM